MSEVSAATPRVADGSLLRPRLVAALRTRFEARVVTVVAPAGFGKTTAVTHAIEQNLINPEGMDLWIPVLPEDSEASLLDRIWRCIDPATTTVAATSAEIVDWVWTQAPKEVCLVFDDLHHVAGSPVERLLAKLIDSLPTNGHVLATSRYEVDLAPAALIGAGLTDQLTMTDLEFTDAELAELDQLSPNDSELPVHRWPVQLALARRAGPREQARYVFEEIVSALDVDRVERLAAIATVDECDQKLFAALFPGRPETLESTVANLPLVSHHQSGAVRLHDLWRDALKGSIDQQRTMEVHAHAAVRFEERRDFADAFSAYLAAADHVGARRAACLQAGRPVVGQSIATLQRCRVLAGRADLKVLRHAFAALEADATRGGQSAAPDLYQAVDLALQADELELAAILGYRLVQISIEDEHRLPPALKTVVDRLRLHDSDSARVAVAHGDIVDALSRGDLREVELGLEALHAVNTPVAQHIRVRVLFDLGRPELVASGDEFVPEGTEVFWGVAMWLRGVFTPEEAVELAVQLGVMSSTSPVVSRVSALGGIVVMAVAAGDHARASAYVDEMSMLSANLTGRNVSSGTHVARAMLALGQRDERAARQAFATALSLAPVDIWPYRSFLLVLPSLYVVVPEVRNRLDAAQFGPTLNTMVNWARILVDLRRTGRTSLTREVDFSEPKLLRAHFTPAMLTELIVAASIEGSGAAAAMLDDIPDRGANLAAVADRYTGEMRRQANRLLRLYPTAPARQCRVLLFGNLQLLVDGTLVDHPDWRRSRVQELLAWLLLNRSGSRQSIAAVLWPESSETAGQNNLRVHLSHLHRLLEPDRRKSWPPWFVRSDGEYLMLETQGLSSDVEDFDSAWKRGLEADRQGVPSIVLEEFGRVGDLYTGDLLGSLPNPDWALYERIERRSRATTALARIGELNSARGEPEVAAEAATIALRIDPLCQRASRVFIRSLQSMDNHSGAHQAARDLIERAEKEGQVLDHETLGLVEPLGLNIGGSSRKPFS